MDNVPWLGRIAIISKHLLRLDLCLTCSLLSGLRPSHLLAFFLHVGLPHLLKLVSVHGKDVLADARVPTFV